MMVTSGLVSVLAVAGKREYLPSKRPVIEAVYARLGEWDTMKEILLDAKE
jgi:hypothetical protein